jgi:hypothetical protein
MPASPPANQRHDLHRIALSEQALGMEAPRHQRPVHLDSAGPGGNPRRTKPPVAAQALKQLRHGRRAVDVALFAVEGDSHGRTLRQCIRRIYRRHAPQMAPGLSENRHQDWKDRIIAG